MGTVSPKWRFVNYHQWMRGRFGIAGRACLLAAMVPTSCVVADAQSAAALRSFYVQSQLEDGEQILEVSQQGQDVRVRTITLVKAHEQCPVVVVRAYDRVLTNTTVRAVAGTSLCSVSEQRFNRAVGAARDTTRNTIDWFGWRGSLVASCSGKERRFLFVQRPGDQVDEVALERRDRQASTIWKLTKAATEGTLVRPPAERPDQEALERLGTALVPDLVGGKYEFAYRDACWDADRKRRIRCEPNYFAWRLEGYTGPPAQRGPLPLRLVDHEKWQFVHYVPPVFPQVALSARLFGDVHIRLDVDSTSGAVTRATIAKSIPILDAAALAAAGQWRFVPGSTPGGPFDVAIRFQVECPGASKR
jgi:TonB family protein